MNPLELVLSKLTGARPAGSNRWSARCPAHDDRNPSLSVSLGASGQVLLNCHAGCPVEQVCDAIGLTLSDLFPTRPTGEKFQSFEASDLQERLLKGIQKKKGPGWRLVNVYRYLSTEGHEVMRVLRFESGNGKEKTFRPIHKAGVEWRVGDPSCLLPLYGLPDLGGETPVYVCEGEKAADAARGLGLTTTTSAHGAKAARKSDWGVLAGRDIVILPDNDDAGRTYAKEVAEVLLALDPPARVRIAALPDLPEHGDVAEFIGGRREVGITDASIREEIERLGRAAPPFKSHPGVHQPEQDDWPCLAKDALYGLVGDFVRMVSPHSEADEVALLLQFLILFGNCIGRRAFFVAEADRHYTNTYGVLVGSTSKGRKGTSYGHVRRVFSICAAEWVKECESNGLSSGEGLIWAVRDPIEKQEPVKERGRVVDHQTVVADGGVTDKRLLVYESEFAQCLRVIGREGNTLSPVVRSAWDTGDMRSLVKNSPARATGAHVSIIGHITREEALRYLDRTEAANGFGNRFLWLCVRRSKALPEGGNLSEVEVEKFASRLRVAIEFGEASGELRRDPEARSLWIEVYEELSEGSLGLVGALTARAEAQVMRLALLFALLDRSPAIRREHLLGGLALWAYAEDSAAHVFGTSVGDPVADQILRALRASPTGLTRTAIRDELHGNRNKGEVDRALDLLSSKNLARPHRPPSDGRGRPPETWFAVSGERTAWGNKSWRSFLSYPGGSAEEASEGREERDGSTTETTKTHSHGGSPQPDGSAPRPEATTETKETTEFVPDGGTRASPTTETTESPSSTETGTPASESQEEFEWKA